MTIIFLFALPLLVLRHLRLIVCLECGFLVLLAFSIIGGGLSVDLVLHCRRIGGSGGLLKRSGRFDAKRRAIVSRQGVIGEGALGHKLGRLRRDWDDLVA